MSTKSPAPDKTPYLHMLWASLAFALMAAFSHWAGERCDWRLVAIARTCVAFFFSFLIAKISGVKLVFWRPKKLWIRSLAGSTGLLCNFYALANLPVSDTLTLMNTAPVWVTLLLWFVFKQKPTGGILFAVAISVIGIALIQQPHFQGGKFACLMALCGAFCTSIAMLGLNRLQSVDPRAIVVHFSCVSSFTTLLFTLFTSHENYVAQVQDIRTVSLLLLVGMAGVAGQMGMTMAFARGQAARVAVVSLTQILFGLIFDVVFWKHQINLISLIGMLLVAAPTAWLIMSETPRQSHDVIEAEMS